MSRTVKTSAILLVLVLLMSNMIIFADSTANVIDDMQFLTADALNALQSRIEQIQGEQSLDTVIVLTDQLDGKSSMAFADDYYDYNGYGIDSQRSGVLLLVNMADREVWISTRGHAIDVFTDSRISDMIGNVTSYLKNGDYEKACNRFLDDVAYYAAQGVPSGQHRVEQDSVYYTDSTYLDRAIALIKNPIVYAVALVISLGLTFLVTSLNKGRVTVNYATYELPGSFELQRSEDTYLREHLTKTKVVKNNSSGGTSSTHTGSSGATHGGGGGKF